MNTIREIKHRERFYLESTCGCIFTCSSQNQNFFIKYTQYMELNDAIEKREYMSENFCARLLD